VHSKVKNSVLPVSADTCFAKAEKVGSGPARSSEAWIRCALAVFRDRASFGSGCVYYVKQDTQIWTALSKLRNDTSSAFYKGAEPGT